MVEFLQFRISSSLQRGRFNFFFFSSLFGLSVRIVFPLPITFFFSSPFFFLLPFFLYFFFFLLFIVLDGLFVGGKRCIIGPVLGRILKMPRFGPLAFYRFREFDVLL